MPIGQYIGLRAVRSPHPYWWGRPTNSDIAVVDRPHHVLRGLCSGRERYVPGVRYQLRAQSDCLVAAAIYPPLTPPEGEGLGGAGYRRISLVRAFFRSGGTFVLAR